MGPKITLTQATKLIPKEQTDNEFFTHFKQIIYPEPLEYETERIDLLTIAHIILNDLVSEVFPDLPVCSTVSTVNPLIPSFSLVSF